MVWLKTMIENYDAEEEHKFLKTKLSNINLI